ncbi:hypothetical protein [Ornithinibacillus xuwenensis]|uniref:DUF3600 domain-containing protein n=1 Tax=Ornithinibacillus xuwenensis TaxID=3144668 RepID=A0ABU9XI11_9BACI
MNQLLNDLKEIMDRSVLKDIDLSEESKANIRKSLYHSSQRKVSHLKPILMTLLSISITCFFLIGSGYFLVDKLDLFHHNAGTVTESMDEIIDLDNINEILAIDKSNPDILRKSEYKSVEDFVLSAKHELNSNPPTYADPSRELWQLDVARWISSYSKHFAALSTDKDEVTLLHNIEKASEQLFKVGDPIKPKENQAQLVKNLNSALDEFINTRIPINN